MKKVTVIINPVFDELDKPGKFFEMSVIVRNKSTDSEIERKIFEKIRYSITDIEEL